MNILDEAVQCGAVEHGSRKDSDYLIEFPSARRLEEFIEQQISKVNEKIMKIDIEPDAWASKIMCIGPDYGQTHYDKLPIQSLNPLYYTHEKLYSEKAVIGLMKAAYYDGYTDREQQSRAAYERA